MDIKFYKSPHKFKGRKGYKPDVIVLHNTGGDKISSAHYWFLNLLSQVSAHFLVGKDGEVRQYVDLKDGAWCNGTSDNPKKHTYYKNATSKIVKSRKYNANYYTVSIECVGDTGDMLTVEQKKAVAKLIKFINEEIKNIYGSAIPLDTDHIIRHCDINPNKSTCGCKIFADDIIRAIKNLDEKATEEPKKENEKIQKGDVVSLLPDAVYYNGRQIPKWVKAKKWIVESVKGDRVVINKGADGENEIQSAVNIKYLKVED